MVGRWIEWLSLFVEGWLWLPPLLLNGFFLYQLSTPFVRPRPQLGWSLLLGFTFTLSSGMIIWVGDPNLLYTLPFFFAAFLLSTQGDWVGRLAVCTVFFCMEMAVCALADTYLKDLLYYYYLARLLRTAFFGGLWLAVRRRLPTEPVALPRRLWRLVLALAAMPLCALAAVVLLTYDKYDTPSIYVLSLNLGLVILPFVLLTSLVLLVAITVLADHERLEQAGRLANLREVYYQALRREDRQVRQLRHDLRNHLTAVQGILEGGDTGRALGYLEEMAGSPALRGRRRFCENETANVVLSAKAQELEEAGLTADFAVSLPVSLPMADTDLCALLGNALDNALEATCRVGAGTVTLRCRRDKGLFMLRVENPTAGPVPPDLSTTKPDKAAHGLGLTGMGEIAGRYGGTLETRVFEGRFELVVCFPMEEG